MDIGYVSIFQACASCHFSQKSPSSPCFFTKYSLNLFGVKKMSNIIYQANLVGKLFRKQLVSRFIAIQTKVGVQELCNKALSLKQKSRTT